MGLCLTRRVGEKLIINDDIIVTVLAAKGKHVRIGIDAPKHMPIIRDNAKNQGVKKKGNTAE